MKLAIVIAAYNEAGNIGPLCQRLLASLRAAPAIGFDLIFVVEGDDGTADALRTLSASAPEIRIIEPAEKRGLGAAFRLGFAAVPDAADMVVTMDADLNHAPEEILGLVAAIDRRDADIVIGSRMVKGAVVNGMPRWKSVLSRSVNTIIRRLFATSIGDQTSGFRVYKADVIRGLKFRNDGFAFLPEILTLARGESLRVVEEPIRFEYRIHGQSKMRLLGTAKSYLVYLSAYRPRFRRFRKKKSSPKTGESRMGRAGLTYPSGNRIAD